MCFDSHHIKFLELMLALTSACMGCKVFWIAEHFAAATSQNMWAFLSTLWDFFQCVLKHKKNAKMQIILL